MTRIEADWLNAAETQTVLSLLSKGGFDAFVVGGCVRNALLGVPVTDIDIATSATPEQVVRLAEEGSLKTVPTGIDHGTVTVLVDHHPFEVTTFRHDVETFGRHARVAFTDRMDEDAHRRDFSMNALYADASGQVIDHVGGLADLQARRVVFVGNAGERIQEDYLRILRFFRFHAQYGDPDEGLDPIALAAIAANIEGLSLLAAERVGSETRKLLSAPDPGPSLGAMHATGVLATILPGSDTNFVGPLIHLEQSAGVVPDPMRRLAALGGTDLTDRLRLSKAEAQQIAVLGRYVAEPAGLAEIAWREGPGAALDICLLRQAIVGQPLPEAALPEIEKGAAAAFPLSARDLMPDLTGPALGAAIKRAERAWIDSDFRLSHADLIGIARKEG
ncbi:MAG: CCA tRNA nucleotidyltransferase [Paracoccaceae bacterium]|nr:CCA tRNA nucleotidyltransferase [Paracoccaceae bacterium]